MQWFRQRICSCQFEVRSTARLFFNLSTEIIQIFFALIDLMQKDVKIPANQLPVLAKTCFLGIRLKFS